MDHTSIMFTYHLDLPNLLALLKISHSFMLQVSPAEERNVKSNELMIEIQVVLAFFEHLLETV